MPSSLEEHQHRGDEKGGATAVTGHVGESPEVAESGCRADGREHETDPGSPALLGARMQIDVTDLT